VTPSITPTSNPFCGDQVIVSQGTSNMTAFNGTYDRVYVWTGGTMNYGYRQQTSETFITGTAPNSLNYVVYKEQSSNRFITRYFNSTTDRGWFFYTGTTSTFGSNTTGSVVFGFTGTTSNGTEKYIRSGLNESNVFIGSNFYASYPSVCPTSTPTNTPSLTPTITSTITPSITPTITTTITPSITPSVTPQVQYVFGYNPKQTVNGGNVLGYSSDGTIISGSSPNANSFLTFSNPRGVNSIASNGSTWVAVGSNGRINPNPVSLGLYSTNGISWSLSNLTSVRTMGNLAMEDVIWDGTRFMGVGGGDPVLVTSTDGITWTGNSNATTGLSMGGGLPLVKEAFIYYDGTSYWVGRDSLFKSTNGINYTAQTITGFTRMCSMIKTSTQWLVGGFGGGTGDGCISRSTDGVNWTQVTIPTNENIYTFATNGSIILAGAQGLGSQPRMLSSTDGITWSAVTSVNALISENCYEIIYDGSKFIAAGAGSSNNSVTISSTDGITWTSVPSLDNFEALSISKK
jgi:hypothetical protein